MNMYPPPVKVNICIRLLNRSKLFMLNLVPRYHMFINDTKASQNTNLLLVLDSTPDKVFFTTSTSQIVSYVSSFS